MSFLRRLAGVLVTSALMTSCGPGARDCDGERACPGRAECVEGRCVPLDGGDLDDAGDPDAIVAVRIEPTELELVSREGAAVSGDFEAFVVEADGDERAVEDVTWILAAPSLATIDAGGGVGIDGSRGGESAVLARFALGETLLTAEARLVARIVRTFPADDVTAEDIARFGGESIEDEGAAPLLLYPVDGALAPRNLRPPVVQWRTSSGDGDLYRVRARSAHVEHTAYFRRGTDFDFAWAIDDGAWHALIDTDRDAAITFEIDRWQASRERLVRGSRTVTMRVARGGVLGEVYYWALDRGRILALDPATSTPREVVPSPPPQPDGQRCMACHAVSRDGRWMFGRRFDDGAGWVVDLSQDLSGDPPPMRYAPRAGIETASFDPSGARMLASDGAGRLFVVDAATGLEIPSIGLPSSGAAMQTWSPSGARAAWIASSDPADPASPSSLMIADITGDDTPTFATASALHDGIDLVTAPEGGARDALPSWTPDDRFLVMQHGVEAFTSGMPGARAALYLIDAEHGATHRLDAIGGGVDRAEAFWPTVSPFVTDEAEGRRLYWVAFHSRRDYGNAIAGTWGRRIRQLWIAAIDVDPEAGVDPSFAPVWLPGQEVGIDNVAAYWAPEPCRGEGLSCGDGSECCSGACVDSAAGLVCAAPPS